MAQIHLLPSPRETHFGATTPLGAVQATVPGRNEDDLFAAKDLEAALKHPGSAKGTAHAKPTAIYRVVLLRTDSVAAKSLLARTKLTFDPAMEAEGYILVIEPHETAIIAASGSGIFYGVQTFKQLLPLPDADRVLPTGTVRDWPAMRYRGVQDDLSRGPVPTLEFQKHQVRIFAAFKANIYSPYFEHTLLYPKRAHGCASGRRAYARRGQRTRRLCTPVSHHHPAGAGGLRASPSRTQVRALPGRCRDTPRPCAGSRSGRPRCRSSRTGSRKSPRSFRRPSCTLAPTKPGTSAQAARATRCRRRAAESVYVAFLKQIHDVLAPLNRRLLFWGDIGGSDPDAVAGLPKDMIAVPWNYWSTTGFDKMIEPFAKAGIETWVAPGDANWNEVYPQARTALWNIQGFIRDGQRLGSTGAINTVWNDDGEGLFNQDWYGVLFGPVASWQAGESPIPDYQDAYGVVFHGDVSGKVNEAQKELMAANEVLGNADLHLSSDSRLLARPVERSRAGGFRKAVAAGCGVATPCGARRGAAGPGPRGKPGFEGAGCAHRHGLGRAQA